MLKAALVNGIIWTAIMFVLFYITEKPVEIIYFIIIFVTFSGIGAAKYYIKFIRKKVD